MTMRFIQKICFLAFFIMLSVQNVNAQTAQVMNENQAVDANLLNPVETPTSDFVESLEEQRLQLNNPMVDPLEIPSLFLTPNEENLIAEAIEGFLTRPPTEDEIVQEQRKAKNDAPVRPRSVREIGLGGILYSSAEEWTIWLNSQKITPENIPPAIINIDVMKDHIKLKWLDFQTNQIFPVKLRPHQRFNFDSRMFLPGASSSQSE